MCKIQCIYKQHLCILLHKPAGRSQRVRVRVRGSLTHKKPLCYYQLRGRKGETECGILGGVSDLPHSHSDDLIRSTLKSSVPRHLPPPAPRLTASPAFSLPVNSAQRLSWDIPSRQLSGFLNASLTHAAKRRFCSSIKAKSRKTARLSKPRQTS